MGHLELDEIVGVEVESLAEWAAKNDTSKLVPYINGRAITGNYPEAIVPSKKHLQFHLEMTPENKGVWIDLLGEPTALHRPVAFSVGPENSGPFDSDIDKSNPTTGWWRCSWCSARCSYWYGWLAARI